MAQIKRHPWSERFSHRTQRAIWGAAAEKMQCQEVICLPVWAWLEPEVKMPKQKAGLAFPHRIDWGSHQLIDANEVEKEATYQWKINALGHNLSGHVSIGPNTHSVEIADEQYPLHKNTPAHIEQEGKVAWWELYSHLSVMVHKSTRLAAGRLSQELPGLEVSPTDIEVAIGDAQTGERAPLLRIMDKATNPQQITAFAKADPLRVITTDIDRSCNDVLRRTLGDPRRGTQIRSIAKRERLRDAEAIKAAYDAYYTDTVSVQAVREAMSICSTLPLFEQGGRP